MKKPTPKYQRILLKLSGEALGLDGVGIDPKVLDRTALEIGQLVGIGIQVGLVIGGGNLFRGRSEEHTSELSHSQQSRMPSSA